MNYRPRFFIKQRGLTAHLLNDTSTRTRALHQQARSWVRMRRSRACCEAALGFHELQTRQGGFKTSYQGEKMFSCGVSRLLCDTARRWSKMQEGEYWWSPAAWQVALQEIQGSPWVPSYMLLESNWTAGELRYCSRSVSGLQGRSANKEHNQVGRALRPARSVKRQAGKAALWRGTRTSPATRGGARTRLEMKYDVKHFLTTVMTPAKPVNTISSSLSSQP